MGSEHTRAGRFRNRAGGLVGSAIVVGWLWSPLLRYSNPLGLFATGIGMSLLIWTIWDRAVIGDAGKPVSRWDWLLLALTVFAGFWTFGSAMYAAQGADRRCAAIQKQMLEPRAVLSDASGKGSDPADVYQALGCRPQFGWW
jgi:hypothetical protein